MAWLQFSSLGHAMREHGVWAYGIVNLVHILGVASLFGSVLILDLRLLGFRRKIPLRDISGPTVPVAATGFTVAALSGACLLATRATEYVGNPFIYIKFPAIGLGILNVIALNSCPPGSNTSSAIFRLANSSSSPYLAASRFSAGSPPSAPAA